MQTTAAPCAAFVTLARSHGTRERLLRVSQGSVVHRASPHSPSVCHARAVAALAAPAARMHQGASVCSSVSSSFGQIVHTRVIECGDRPSRKRLHVLTRLIDRSKPTDAPDWCIVNSVVVFAGIDSEAAWGVAAWASLAPILFDPSHSKSWAASWSCQSRWRCNRALQSYPCDARRMLALSCSQLSLSL